MSKSIEKIAIIAGLIGFVIEIISFIIQVMVGEISAVLALRWFGYIGIAVWAVWVTFALLRIQNIRSNDNLLSSEKGIPDGFVLENLYFDGTNRSIYEDLKYGPGDDRKGTDYEDKEIGNVMPEGEILKVYRNYEKIRFIVSVRKYLNTLMAKNDSFIPADPDHEVKGSFVRYIYFEFKARIKNKPHEIFARLRRTNGLWLTRSGISKDYASKKFHLRNKTWNTFAGVLGPVIADEPCYFGLDIQPGPSGSENSLYIRDLKIIEIREK